MQDTHALLQSMFGSVLAEMESDREASQADMAAIKAEIEGNYTALVKAMLESSGHAPLAEAELAAVALQQTQLVQQCEAKFNEIVGAIQRVEEEYTIADPEHAIIQQTVLPTHIWAPNIIET